MILEEFKVAVGSCTMRSSPEYFVKISFPRCCWQESYGLGIGLSMKLQDEQLPLSVFAFTCI